MALTRLLVALVLLSVSVSAQTPTAPVSTGSMTSTTCTAATAGNQAGCVQLNVSGYGAVGVQLRWSERFDAYLKAVFTALWVEQKNLNDPAVLMATLAAAGFDPAAMQVLVAEPAVKDTLRANTEGAVARGAFGAPTMFVGETMFFGQDRLDFVREALL